MWSAYLRGILQCNKWQKLWVIRSPAHHCSFTKPVSQLGWEDYSIKIILIVLLLINDLDKTSSCDKFMWEHMLPSSENYPQSQVSLLLRINLRLRDKFLSCLWRPYSLVPKINCRAQTISNVCHANLHMPLCLSDPIPIWPRNVAKFR